MSAKGSLFRLAFLILLLPAGILLFLHFFGQNKLDVPVYDEVTCKINGRTKVVLTGIVETNINRNQKNRLVKKLESKGLKLDTTDYNCLPDSLSLILIDKKNFLRGSYDLNHKDIGRFFAELDIVLLNDNYGEGVSR